MKIFLEIEISNTASLTGPDALEQIVKGRVDDMIASDVMLQTFVKGYKITIK